jgi:hypothetical protein
MQRSLRALMRDPVPAEAQTMTMPRRSDRHSEFDSPTGMGTDVPKVGPVAPDGWRPPPMRGTVAEYRETARIVGFGAGDRIWREE